MRYGDQQDASTNKVFLVGQPRMCHNSPQISHLVNSKSTPEKSTQSSKSQRSATTIKSTQLQLRSTFDLDFCANEYDLQESNSPQNFSQFGPCVDQSQRWSNLPRNLNCRKFAAVNFVLFAAVDFVLLLMWEMKMLLRCSYIIRGEDV